MEKKNRKVKCGHCGYLCWDGSEIVPYMSFICGHHLCNICGSDKKASRLRSTKKRGKRKSLTTRPLLPRSDRSSLKGENHVGNMGIR